jgi:hypothetical protein
VELHLEIRWATSEAPADKNQKRPESKVCLKTLIFLGKYHVGHKHTRFPSQNNHPTYMEEPIKNRWAKSIRKLHAFEFPTPHLRTTNTPDPHTNLVHDYDAVMKHRNQLKRKVTSYNLLETLVARWKLGHGGTQLPSLDSNEKTGMRTSGLLSAPRSRGLHWFNPAVGEPRPSAVGEPPPPTIPPSSAILSLSLSGLTEKREKEKRPKEPD